MAENDVYVFIGCGELHARESILAKVTEERGA